MKKRLRTAKNVFLCMMDSLLKKVCNIVRFFTLFEAKDRNIYERFARGGFVYSQTNAFSCNVLTLYAKRFFAWCVPSLWWAFGGLNLFDI